MTSPIATRYGVAYCTTCDLALDYCRCLITQAARVLAERQRTTTVVGGMCALCALELRSCRCGSTPARNGA